MQHLSPGTLVVNIPDKCRICEHLTDDCVYEMCPKKVKTNANR